MGGRPSWRRAQAITIASDAGARRPSLKQIGLEPIDNGGSAAIARAPSPMVRDRDRRDRLGAPAAGSGVAHLLVLLALLVVLPKPQGGGPAPEPSTVEMMFPKPGSSGMTGAPASGGAPAETPPPPVVAAPPPPLPAPPTPAPAEPAPAAPETLPRLAEKAPAPAAPRPAAPRMMRLRTRSTARPHTSTSPFSAPMDLSFASPDASRPARARRGSSSSVDLSLGPMVRNGTLRIPYASAGIRGVSPDYDAELQDWIQRHLYYPEDAARRGEDGTSSVHVVLDRSGQVRSVELTTSAGSDSLDDATSGMFRGATLPPVPPDMTGSHFDIDLTVHYILLRGNG